MKTVNLIYQFKITLQEIEPPIWRRIQVPATYSFWDLHVAIADSMGWHDYHLHMFRFRFTVIRLLETLAAKLPREA